MGTNRRSGSNSSSTVVSGSEETGRSVSEALQEQRNRLGGFICEMLVEKVRKLISQVSD